jgi:hypothetical protein
MLQWNDGTWEHRAYWGANNISYGINGTASRRYIGPLPPSGQWVRLEVPAAQVALEGRNVSGMAFTLYGGRATWDAAGVLNPNVVIHVPGITVSATDACRVSMTSGAFTLTRDGDVGNALMVSYALTGTATDDDFESDGPALSATAPSVTIPAGSASVSIPVTPTATTNIVGSQSLILTLSPGSDYTVGDPSNAVVNIAGNAVPSPGLNMTAPGAAPALTWPAIAGAVYRVAHKHKLTDPGWNFISGEIDGDGGMASWNDPAGADASVGYFMIIRIL